jgi:hypothetical protein
VPRALADAFGGEKRIEGVTPNLRGDPRPVISDFDHNAVFLSKSPNAKRPLASHCVDGVLD